MSDEEALARVHKAIEAARSRVGDDKNAIREDLRQQRATDPTLFEAFKQIGQLMQSTQQGH